MTLSALPSASGSAYMSPWRRLDGDARRLQLDPGQPQHFRRAVDADRLRGARPEQLDHPAGAGADVDQPAERPVAERAVDRLLDLAFGDVERADLVPHLGMGGEIARRRLRRGRRGPRRAAPRRRRTAPRLAASAQRSISSNSGSVRVGVGRASGTPSCLPCGARRTPASARILHVARHPRLALAEHLGELADRQLHRPQQREDAQPRRIGKRLEQVGEREARRHGIRI